MRTQYNNLRGFFILTISWNGKTTRIAGAVSRNNFKFFYSYIE